MAQTKNYKILEDGHLLLLFGVLRCVRNGGGGG